MHRVPTLLTLALLACQTRGEDPATASDGLERAPAGKALRRLNRSEYDRTVRDLLGTETRPGVDFPPDDSSHGFDNAADALSVSPLLFEAWEQAAGRLAKEIVDAPLEAPLVVEHEAEGDGWTSSNTCNGPAGSWFSMWCGGSLVRNVEVPESGTWRVSAVVTGQQAGPELVQASLLVDDRILGTFDVAAESGIDTETLSVEIELSEGSHSIGVSFDNDWFGELEGDRNLLIDAVTFEGPTPFFPRPNPAWDRVMTCEPEGPEALDCITRILEAFTPRAWRRPLADGELDGLVAIAREVVDAGDSPLWGLEMALRAVLTSPHFVFLVEDAGAGTLDDHALASRLSYFLWSSMPDDELLQLAADGTLGDPEVLAAQVRRMLRDPRASAMTDDFAGQWLFIRAVDNAFPDVYAFPRYTDALRDAMKEQMRRLFSSFVGTNKPMTRLLTSEFGYLDPSLAAFYGYEATEVRPGFGAYNLTSIDRIGWLGQAGLQMSLSYPTRTSPVRRGVWVLGHLLCSEPAAPPPGVEGLEEDAEGARTLREQLEQHRAAPACAGCHDDIDPIGFAFEHYDGIGAWRDSEHGVPIDATGELPDGTTFAGLTELSTLLAEDERFTRCIVEQGFTYAMGRQPTASEEGILEDAHQTFVAEGTTLDALATAIVTSPSFLAPAEVP